MARSYLFLKPSELPLSAAELDESSVSPIDPEEAIASLKQAMPFLVWSSATEASGEAEEGWVQFSQPGDGATRSLALRCSLRSDYTPLVQSLCNRFGWVAFDETPALFQPNRPPEAL